MQIYDLWCSQCETQLNFRESTDPDGDALILVDPCPHCSPEQVAGQLDSVGDRLGQLADLLEAQGATDLYEEASDNLAQLIDIVSNLDPETYKPALDQAQEVLDRLNEKLAE